MIRNFLAVLFLAPGVLLAESAIPSLGYTGANAVPSDHGGQNCSTCHNSFGAANSDSSGSMQITIANPTPNTYIPNITQTIKILVQHPSTTRWGFQITVREVSDETQSVGTFSASAPGDLVQTQVVCDNGSQFGSAPPCVNQRQYAEHKGTAISTVGGSIEFDIPWTAPSTEVGTLHIYAAAVAANGDGSPNGDAVYTSVLTVANGGACENFSHGVLKTAVNAGSFQPPLSSNALISILGDQFEPSAIMRIAGLGDLQGNAFPTELACVGIQVKGPGLPSDGVMIPITYVQGNQINAQLPRFSGTGSFTLQVLVNPGQNNVFVTDVDTYTLQPFAPAFFLLANSNNIAAQFAGKANVVAAPSLVPGASPAKPGDIVTLYGTGFGDTNPLVGAGQITSGQAPLVNGVTVTIGTVTLSSGDVLYAGLTPGSISGLYQFNVRIPASTPNGNIPVSISIGGVQTQSGAFIPVQQ